MASKLWLNSTLASLRLMSKSPYLHKNTSDPKELLNTIKEFKQKLLCSLDSGDLSDEFLVNTVNCLYDLKTCDKNTCLALCRSFESRKNIISRQLEGGVLWTFYNGQLNTKRRKIITSSCRVTIKQAITKFRELKGKVTDVVEFEKIIRNLNVVGKCYKVPISSKTRLEDSILEASSIFRLVFDCFPLIVPLTASAASLNLHNEKVADILLDAFCDVLHRDDMITNDEIHLMLKTLLEWNIPKLGVERKCIEIFVEKLLQKTYPFFDNASATIKLFSETIKLPKDDIVFRLSNVLISHVLSNTQFCTNTDLITVLDTVSHFVFQYGSYKGANIDLYNLRKLVDNVLCHICAEYNASYSGTNTLDTLLKIYKSSIILNRICDNRSKKLEEVSLGLVKLMDTEGKVEDRIVKIQNKFSVK